MTVLCTARLIFRVAMLQAIFCAANTQYSCKSMINFTELNGKYDLEVYFPGVRFSRVRECIAKQCSVLRE